ncbi:peptidase S41 [Paenibacillus beijingensis]|uniref:Peptidase S41 n=1 Tax=Paenibacillus beijingensis TaxID=1126833 RepID=A0A0D5NQA9_9BACL|nr:peptidase S41 [Paenibacillus beijingensis]
MLAAFIFLLVGFMIGRLSMTLQYPILSEKAFGNLSKSYQEIKNDYLFGVKPGQLINGAVKGMVASLEDPYSVYLPGEQGEDYMKSYQPEFVGIGVEVRIEDGNYIIDSVIKGTPAEKNGLMAGDLLAKVDGTAVSGKSMAELVGLLRGKEGTKVKVTLLRPGTGKQIVTELTRAQIPVTTVSSEMKNDGIGKITISRFAQSTADEFNKAFDSLQKKGMKSLLLDMRSNPGGLLVPTIEIANRLVPKGKLVLEVDHKDKKKVQTYRSKQQKPIQLPIVVLVDGQTASAAEVLTAALKESAGATVVGTTTFGKGIVQTFGQFRDRSVLKLTEAQWKTPNGEWIHKRGVDPDEKVEPPSYASLPAIPTGIHLKRNDYGDNVKTLQSMLVALGYKTGDSPGIFNESTVTALQHFQQAEGLTVDGELTDKTAYRLMERLRSKLAEEDPQQAAGLKLLRNR